MKRKITAILMTAALMLTMAACAGNSTADTGVESSASSAVSSKPVSSTSSTAASSAKPSASAKPTATPSAGTTATAKPTATPKPERKTESSTAGKASATAKPSATATPKPAATAKPSSSHTSNSKPSGSAARPTPAPTAKPTAAPTAAPTAKPTAAPTAAPTAVPTATPKPKEKVWVVDTPAREEVGHWEEDYWMGSDWVYQCNACGTQFSTVDEFESHSDYEWELGNDHGSYTMTSGEMYKHYTGEKYWVVDIPAQDEVGHWEYR